MIHLKLVYMLIVLASGVVALSIAGSVYHRRRKRVLLDFGGFLLSLLLILASFLPELYLRAGATLDETIAVAVAWLIMAAGSSVYVWVAPGFYYRILGLPVTRAARIARLSVAVLFQIGVILFFVLRFSRVISVALNTILFAAVAYGIILLGANVRKLTDPDLRRALFVFVLVSAGFFPLMYVDSLVLSLSPPSALAFINGMSLPTYLLCLNVTGTIFAFRYLDRPPFFAEGSLTQEFVSRYGITPREKEIIEGLLEGEKAKDLAERLFIAGKTVENHIYNIYQKTGVGNRIQLFTLIQANRVD